MLMQFRPALCSNKRFKLKPIQFVIFVKARNVTKISTRGRIMITAAIALQGGFLVLDLHCSLDRSGSNEVLKSGCNL